MLRSLFSAIAVLCFILPASAQQTAIVYGNVADENLKPLPGANIVLVGTTTGTTTDSKGNYEIRVPANDSIVLQYTFVGYDTVYQKSLFLPNERYVLVVQLQSGIYIKGVEIKAHDNMIRVQPVDLEPIPSTLDPLTAILRALGASSNNELTSQYSIRGGNYDENLVYVNDFEIYRPQLARSGQQEGLPFPNYDLISKIGFSAGGFEAKYGDKLSSVLDIQYKQPKEFEAGITASLLGASAYINNGSDTDKVYYLIGGRYKTNKYLLNSLNTTGQYEPLFVDLQSLIGFKLNKKSYIEVLGNFSFNSYQFTPESRSTSTGVVNQVIKLDVFFDGQEVDEFITGFGGIAYHLAPNKKTTISFLASGYHSLEAETFDIIGAYWLGQVETNLGDEDFGDIIYGLGSGAFQNFARNYLTSDVINLSHNGSYDTGLHFIEWGARAQYEYVTDELKEWTEQDSAGYSIPYTGEQVLLDYVFKSTVELSSLRYSGYAQDTWEPAYRNFALTYGIRSSYWDLNNEVTVTPRVQAIWTPAWRRKKDDSKIDLAFKGAVGMYHQPPFYRELRDREGVVNTDVQSQKSVHVLIGGDYNFTAWNRDFRFISELYYKYMWDLVPYDIDNVRIRYYGDNVAVGYAAGIDLRLHGEIVEDADSWISLSFLRTMEDIDGDSTFNVIYDEFGNIDSLIPVEQGYISRPTDQLVNFGMFFQDYMPGNKNFKVHLSLLIGSGLPYGAPNSESTRNSAKMPPYRRVDIGFSALLLDKNRDRTDKGNLNKAFESVWASLEVFNLLGIQNTISYFWVKDIYNDQYAFPNYLTDRRINLKIVAKF